MITQASTPIRTDRDKGLCVLKLETLCRAIRDPNISRPGLKVCANLIERLNSETRTAWPSRESIAADEGISEKSVSNLLYDLRAGNYVIWVRMPAPGRQRGTLLQYALASDPIARNSFEQKLDAVAETARSNGQVSYPSRRAMPAAAGHQTARPSGPETARPSGNKELIEGTLKKREMDAPRATQHCRQFPAPHMNGVGFVISEAERLIIPTPTVDAWRLRFPHIPDLESSMIGLATTMLSKGPMHPGWRCPEGWMVKPLSEIDSEARTRSNASPPRKPSRW